MFSKILVAVDGTATSNRGLAFAVGLAKEQGATLYVLHVMDELMITPMLDGAAPGTPGYVDRVLASIRESGRKLLARAEATASKSISDVHADMVASAGQPVASAILRYAKRVRADLIVLGTHGRRGLRRLVMGSDAEAVLRGASVPVLLVRSPERKSHARPSKSPKAGAKGRAASAQAPIMSGL